MLPPPPESIVEFSIEDGLDARWDEPRITALVRSIISAEPALAPARYAIGLHLVHDATIRALNAEHRGQDVPTDVLSFPLIDPDGVDFVVPPGQLLGYDHEDDADRSRMRQREEEALRPFGFIR